MNRVALGLGCDRGASPKTLEAAVRAALASVGLGLDAVALAASIDAKQDEPGILGLASARGWPLRFYSAQALAGVPVPSPSEIVRRLMGTPAVAEAAALLAAGAAGPEAPLPESLMVHKHKHRGADGKHVTVAVARIHEPATDDA